MVVSLCLLVAVLFIWVERNSAKRLAEIAGMSVQPSELAKFTMMLYMASFMAKRRKAYERFAAA